MIKTSDAMMMYMDDVVLPIESTGLCLRTTPVHTFYKSPTRIPLVIIYCDDLTKKERRKCLKSYKLKPKRIKVTTYISHMLVDKDKNIIESKPITLANGYCEDCWDMGLGGNIPANTYLWKTLRKSRAK